MTILTIADGTQSTMIVRCQLCNTPLFELTFREGECIIIIKRKHHGERHKSLIRIEDLIARLKEESPDDPNPD